MIYDPFSNAQHTELRRRWQEKGCLKTPSQTMDDAEAARLWRTMAIIELMYRNELALEEEEEEVEAAETEHE